MLANVPEGLTRMHAEKQAGRLMCARTRAARTHTTISINVWHTDANIHTRYKNHYIYNNEYVYSVITGPMWFNKN